MVTARYVLTVVTVALGASTQFYTYGVINPSQELLEEWINKTYYHRNGHGMTSMSLSVYWSFVVSSVAIGAFIGSLLTRRLAETCGRRNGLIANGIVNVFGALFESIAKGTKSPELLILGRFILGANMGLTSGLVPMYLMEISPVRYRGAAGTVHQVAVAFSDWFSLLLGLPAILGGEQLWPLAVAFPGIPALLLCIILPLCPESPRYTLISLGRRDEAYKAVRTLVGEQQAKATFESLIKEAALSPVSACKHVWPAEGRRPSARLHTVKSSYSTRTKNIHLAQSLRREEGFCDWQIDRGRGIYSRNDARALRPRQLCVCCRKTQTPTCPTCSAANR